MMTLCSEGKSLLTFCANDAEYGGIAYVQEVIYVG